MHTEVLVLPLLQLGTIQYMSHGELLRIILLIFYMPMQYSCVSVLKYIENGIFDSPAIHFCGWITNFKLYRVLTRGTIGNMLFKVHIHLIHLLTFLEVYILGTAVWHEIENTAKLPWNFCLTIFTYKYYVELVYDWGRSMVHIWILNTQDMLWFSPTLRYLFVFVLNMFSYYNPNLLIFLCRT